MLRGRIARRNLEGNKGLLGALIPRRIVVEVFDSQNVLLTLVINFRKTSTFYSLLYLNIMNYLFCSLKFMFPSP